MKFELKNIHVNTRFSRETNCFQANIYADGVQVGTTENNGNGGSDNLHIQDKAVYEELQKQSLVAHPDFAKHPSSAIECFISDMLEKWEEEKQYRRWCKKMLCFRLPDDKSGSWRTMRGPAALTPEVRAQVIKKYGNTVEFLNDRFV